MDTQKEIWEGAGILVENSRQLSIQLPDGTIHTVAEDDYVECRCRTNGIDQCCSLNQRYDPQYNMWYMDRCFAPFNDDPLTVRFRKARPGERHKQGYLVVDEKDKLRIVLWDDTSREIASGTQLALCLPGDWAGYEAGRKVAYVWRQCCVKFDTQKWVYCDVDDHPHVRPLDNEQPARIVI